MRRPERGAGTLSTTFGVGVFLAMLLMSSHVMLNLWVISSVESIAHDAATDVATSGATYDTRAGAERLAIQRANLALGRQADDVDLRFESTPSEVVLSVSAPGLKILPGPAAAALGLDGFERSVVVVWEPTE